MTSSRIILAVRLGLALSIDPALVELHTTPDGRAVTGWDDTVQHTANGDCVTLHEVTATLKPTGEIGLTSNDLRNHGAGCPVYPPEKQNFFPD